MPVAVDHVVDEQLGARRPDGVVQPREFIAQAFSGILLEVVPEELLADFRRDDAVLVGPGQGARKFPVEVDHRRVVLPACAYLFYELLREGQVPVGEFFVLALPKVIKALTVIGTIAMLLVAGGIFVHNVEVIHHLVDGIPFIFGELLVGLVVGAVAVGAMMMVKKIKG